MPAAVGGLGNYQRTAASTPADGRFVNASNTGLAGIGVSGGSLTTLGSTLYNSSFNGQTISGNRYTGEVTITGSNITFAGNWMNWGGTSGNGTDIAMEVSGSNNKVQDCLFQSATGHAFYIGILMSGGSGNIIQRCDIGQSENGITLDNGTITNPLIQLNYIHDMTGNDNDCIEFYAAISGAQVLNNWLSQPPAPWDTIVSATGNESSFNIAPYASGHSVSNTLFQGNFCDGGIVSIVIDNQSTGTITNTKIIQNWFGGHNSNVVGIYNALQNNDGRAITHSDAAQALDTNSIQWPNSGSDSNHWYNSSSLTPDNSGQIINVG